MFLNIFKETSESSFSAVSGPTFADKYLFCRIRGISNFEHFCTIPASEIKSNNRWSSFLHSRNFNCSSFLELILMKINISYIGNSLEDLVRKKSQGVDNLCVKLRKILKIFQFLRIGRVGSNCVFFRI